MGILSANETTHILGRTEFVNMLINNRTVSAYKANRFKKGIRHLHPIDIDCNLLAKKIQRCFPKECAGRSFADPRIFMDTQRTGIYFVFVSDASKVLALKYGMGKTVNDAKESMVELRIGYKRIADGDTE